MGASFIYGKWYCGLCCFDSRILTDLLKNRIFCDRSLCHPSFHLEMIQDPGKKAGKTLGFAFALNRWAATARGW
jgi:hypothetical protein